MKRIHYTLMIVLWVLMLVISLYNLLVVTKGMRETKKSVDNLTDQLIDLELIYDEVQE